VILDVSNPAQIKKVGQLPFTPPFLGNIGAHSALPLPKRNLALVNSESIREDCNEPLNHASVVDVSNPANPTLLALMPLPVPRASDVQGLLPEGWTIRAAQHQPAPPQPVHRPFGYARVLDVLQCWPARVRHLGRHASEGSGVVPAAGSVHRYGPQPVGSLVEQTEDVLVDTRGYIYVTNKNQGLWILKLDREDDN